jgi:hypothetical protein
MRDGCFCISTKEIQSRGHDAEVASTSSQTPSPQLQSLGHQPLFSSRASQTSSPQNVAYCERYPGTMGAMVELAVGSLVELNLVELSCPPALGNMVATANDTRTSATCRLLQPQSG